VSGTSLAWVGIGLCVIGWLIGLLLEIGPVVHLLLVVAVILLVLELRRGREA
jgi:Family of unknown function (DUF5670)